MIGIIGALDIEVEHLLQSVENQTIQLISGVEYVKGKLHDKEVVVAKCGVGKVFSAMCAQTMLLNYSVEAVLNIGVAGGLKEETDIGDVVIAQNVVQHDMDTSGIGDVPGMISGLDLVHIPCSKSIVKMLDNVMQNINVKHKIGTIATGDQFIRDTGKTKKINESFDAIAFDMESASIGQVCYVNNVDFGIIRSISDNGTEDAAQDFLQFAKKAAKISSDIVEGFIDRISK